MAKKLKSFDFTGRRGNRKYPWEEWTNGEVWRVEAGKDFVVRVSSFVQAAYQYGRRCGKKVRTQVGLDHVVFQFYESEEAE